MFLRDREGKRGRPTWSTVVKSPRLSIALLSLSTAVTLTAPAHGNGRYPAAQFFVVGEGTQSNRIAIVTTFGLVTSTDGGRSWSWVCEEAVGYTGQYDPAIAVTSDGTLLSSLPDGLSRTSGADWCEWSRPATFPTEPVTDIANVGGTVVAAVSPPAAPQYVARSSDHGATWTRGWARPEFYMHTIDVAPSNTARVYTTGWVRGAFPALFRSDDGGGDFIEATRSFGTGYIAFISWVDPTSADTLLVRADLDPSGTLLMRSDDGGSNFRTILRGSSSMVATAAEPGARRLWASTTALAERIQRSEDGGETWTSVGSTLRPRSLRFVNGTLFATATEMNAGMSFACSRDLGETFVPMLILNQLRGPEACPAGSTVRVRCAAQWDAVRAQLVAITRPPVGSTGTCETSATDAGTQDATQRDDAASDGGIADGQGGERSDARIDGADGGMLRTAGGCSCSVAARAPRGDSSRWALFSLGVVAVVVGARRSTRRFVGRARALR
jgi:hypothetical protein